MKRFFFLCFLFNCGTQPEVEDHKKKEQSIEDIGETTLKIDAGNVIDILCQEKNLLTWRCAKRCVSFPDKSWCHVYNEYCNSVQGQDDIEFCEWWKNQ